MISYGMLPIRENMATTI